MAFFNKSNYYATQLYGADLESTVAFDIGVQIYDEISLEIPATVTAKAIVVSGRSTTEVAVVVTPTANTTVFDISGTVTFAEDDTVILEFTITDANGKLHTAELEVV